MHASLFLANRMRASDILPWGRKYYLTHVTLPKLPRECCTLVVLELTRMVVKWYNGYVQRMSSCHVAFQRGQELLGVFLNIKCGIYI